MKKLLLTMVLLLACQGCVPLLIGGAIYGVQKGKQNKTERLKVYNRYKMAMEKLNMEREEKNLVPIEILDFYEWNEQGSTD